MQNNFTHEDLIALIYNELDASRRFSLYKALENQPELMKTYEQLCAAHQELPKVLFSPSDKAIRNILTYGERHHLV